MRIRKALITIETFMKPFKLKYQVRNYTPDGDKDEPIICFGCYTKRVMQWVVEHRGLCVIVWSGSDSMNLKTQTWFVNHCKENKDRIRHIAYSHWIKSDLEAVGLEYIEKVVLPCTFDWLKFEPEHQGKIYHYTVQHKSRRWFYGTDDIKNWEKRNRLLQNKIIYTNFYAYKQNELYELYKSSFMGIRLTDHDNMALSCIEMGLMGRRSIFNGNIPCAINYEDKEEAKRLMLDMFKNQPEPDKLVAEEMREFVHDDMKWLNTEYYD
jgi:hypothetical protein